MRNIASVVFDGKVLDGRYHAWFNEMNLFRGDGFIGIPAVEDLALTLVRKRAVYREGQVGRVARGTPGATRHRDDRHAAPGVLRRVRVQGRGT